MGPGPIGKPGPHGNSSRWLLFIGITILAFRHFLEKHRRGEKSFTRVEHLREQGLLGKERPKNG